MAALSVYSDWQRPAGLTEPDEFNASELAEALIGFLEPSDCPLFSIDDIFNAADDNAFAADHDTVCAAVPDNLFRIDPDDRCCYSGEPQHTLCFDPNPFAAEFATAEPPELNYFRQTPENDLLPSRSSPDHCSLHCCAKRHRCCYSGEPQQSLCFEPNPFEAEFATAEPPEPHFFRPTPLAELAFDPPPKTTAGLSSQSAAARVRRKRISDKTEELSRLIPGGGKMNTADMLQAAHKYVRYLQAQISILGLDTCDKEQSGEEDELLRVLISSAAIQEKLSKQGMCLLRKETAEEFVADPLLKFNPFMEREINKFSQLIRQKA